MDELAERGGEGGRYRKSCVNAMGGKVSRGVSSDLWELSGMGGVEYTENRVDVGEYIAHCPGT